MATQAALAQVVQTESARLQQYLTALPADAWMQPSACALWDIRDVVAHLSGIAHGYTDRITRGLQGDTSPSQGFPAPDIFKTLSGEERRQRAISFSVAEMSAIASGVPSFPDSFGLNLALNSLQELGHGERTEVAFRAFTDSHGLGGLLFVAYHKHVRDLFELGFANLVADFFGPVIAAHAQAAAG